MTALSEADGLAALFAIAAIHGGTVQRLYDFRTAKRSGYAWMRDAMMPNWLTDATWVFVAGNLEWRSPKSLSPSGVVIPVRIDRGLGAVRP